MTQKFARLAIFDLDHTLIEGDSDTLWCDYLLQQGLLPPQWSQDNQALQAQYAAGTVSAHAFCSFYAQTLAMLEPAQARQLRTSFTQECIVPRIKQGALPLLQQHRACGDTTVLSSATSHFLIHETAQHLGFVHVLGTELQTDALGRFTGVPEGVLNMRAGKVQRLQAWLSSQGWPDTAATWSQACFYSDSANDLPLLQAVGHPVVVDPDPLLRQTAMERQWPILCLS